MTATRFLLPSALLGVLLTGACQNIPVYKEALGTYPEPPGTPETLLPQLADPINTFWRPGYWAPGTGDSFVWIPGAVLERPHPTAVWTTARWVRHIYGWTFVPGHWD
ncbi:MAG: hypothetical protein PHS57_01325 [Alphaproteobacteria bacterium]|nr:hypothetical protein [Alphaproteobacteria bacterium]